MKTFSFISIKEGHFKARYEVYKEATGDNHLITYENAVPPHKSLSEAVQHMGKHLIHFTKMMLLDEEDLQVTGFQKQNSGNVQLLTIYARLGRGDDFGGNVMGRFHIGRDEYAYLDELLSDIALCEEEAEAYIERGKRLGQEQFVLFDQEDLVTLNVA